MTLEFFKELVSGHKEANRLERTVFYVHYREVGFESCLSKMQGVEGDTEWDRLMDQFEKGKGELEITDMFLYSDGLANCWGVSNQSPWHVLQKCDFDDEEYVHLNCPFLDGKGDFTVIK